MADRDTWPEDPNTPAPAKKSSGGCGKTILIICGFGFLTLLLCCGVGGWVGYSFMPKISTTPAEVSEVAKQVLDMKIPDDFQGESAISMQNFALSMHIATFNQKEGKGGLILGSFEIKAGDGQQKADFNSKMNEKFNLRMGDSKVRDFKVRGQNVPFRFSDATEEGTDAEFRVVEADFKTGKKETFIKYVIPADQYDEDAVVEMIESIK